jgi:uncharacterized protein YjdB
LKKKATRFISVLLVLMMILSFAQVSSFAENTAQGENEYAVNAAVTEYLVAPSQYTNSSSYGRYIDKTVTGAAATTSLGNFGGYAVYKFADKISNSDKNAYGVDFMVTGNAFSASASVQEPGQVWISQDGKTWYALAGSEHFEDATKWNYSVTYHNTGDTKVTYTDSDGESGRVSSITAASYPDQGIYDKVTIPQDNLTLSGILLSKQRTASTSNGISTSFGYVDALNGSVTNISSNPYLKDPANNCKDGQFDISWAVDKNGQPVNLDWIQYVKVQTAVFIDGGVFGEKSTEINAVTLPKQADSEVGKTAAPKSITVGNQKITLAEGKNTYDVNLNGATSFDVNVDSDANVYINNTYGSQRSFQSVPDKGVVRVIVQSGNCEPQIYFLNIVGKQSNEYVTISNSAVEIEQGSTAQLTAAVSPNTAEQTITWSSSNSSVVSVGSDGKLTANSVGEADITAASATGKTAVCKVTVTPAKEAETVCVTFSSFDGTIIMPKQEVTASAGLAKKYGYDVAQKDHNGKNVVGVTFFDVLVAAHKLYYKDAFTPETAKNYLVMSKSFITKAFGKSASSSSFTVDKTMPNDGIINEKYGTYTGYACDTAVLKSGNDVTYFFYQDTTNWSDYYTWFDSAQYNANAGQPLQMNLKGYCAMWYGVNDFSTIEEKYTVAVPNADLYIYQDGISTRIGTTDSNGTATVTFASAGTYQVYAIGKVIDKYDEECPIIAPWCTVTVTDTSVPVSSIAISDDSLTLKKGSAAVLGATVSPDNATDKSVTWTSSDPKVATVDANGKVTAVGKGTAIITVSDASGSHTASCKVTVKLTFWQWLLSIIKWIVWIPCRIFKFIFGWIK